MNYRMPLAIVITLLTLALIAGCAAPPQATTPVPTTPATTPAQTAAQTSPPVGSLVPGPIQTLPAEKSVGFDVVRDQILPTITVSFRGGKGQAQVRDIDVRVTRSDGMVSSQKLGHNVGDSVTFDGTKGKDRVEITVTFITNDQYKVLDALYDYYSHT